MAYMKKLYEKHLDELEEFLQTLNNNYDSNGWWFHVKGPCIYNSIGVDEDSIRLTNKFKEYWDDETIMQGSKTIRLEDFKIEVASYMSESEISIDMLALYYELLYKSFGDEWPQKCRKKLEEDKVRQQTQSDDEIKEASKYIETLKKNLELLDKLSRTFDYKKRNEIKKQLESMRFNDYDSRLIKYIEDDEKWIAEIRSNLKFKLKCIEKKLAILKNLESAQPQKNA